MRNVGYTYWNQYAGGARTLLSGRAIAFVPQFDGPIGTLAGSVYNASAGNAPVGGARVMVDDTERVLTTNAAGNYTGAIPPGTYTVVVQHESFAPDTTHGVVIVQDEITTQDFYLIDIAGPAITTATHPWTDDTEGPYEIPVTIVEYSGLAEKTLFYRINGGSSQPLPLVPQGGDLYLASIPGQPYTTAVEYYVYARDALGFETLDPPAAPLEMYLFYVVPLEVLLDDPFESVAGWTVGAPGDNATSGIWVREEPVGSVAGVNQVQPDFDHTPDPGEICFVTGNALPGQSAGTNDVDDGRTTLVSPVFNLEGFTTVSLRYWVWYTNEYGGAPGEDVWLVQLTHNGNDWVNLENTTVSTGGWAERNFVLEDYIHFSDHVQLRFVASDEGAGSLVEAAIDDFLLTGMSVTAGEGPVPAPLVQTGLDPCRPNPFNPNTRISWRIGTTGLVKIRVFDVAGRHIRTLVDGVMLAGEHEIRWDGCNLVGRVCASGVYFLRLDTPGFMQVQQMTLVR